MSKRKGKNFVDLESNLIQIQSIIMEEKEQKEEKEEEEKNHKINAI
jgi:hypothetical protein